VALEEPLQLESAGHIMHRTTVKHIRSGKSSHAESEGGGPGGGVESASDITDLSASIRSLARTTFDWR